MKLLGSTESKINKIENGENLPSLEITEEVLVHFNIFIHYYKEDSRVLYKFVSKKLFSQFLETIFQKSNCSIS